jgi:hypothetical protein
MQAEIGETELLQSEIYIVERYLVHKQSTVSQNKTLQIRKPKLAAAQIVCISCDNFFIENP